MAVFGLEAALKIDGIEDPAVSRQRTQYCQPSLLPLTWYVLSMSEQAQVRRFIASGRSCRYQSTSQIEIHSEQRLLDEGHPRVPGALAANLQQA